jgi:AraC-like DNA-binding protein
VQEATEEKLGEEIRNVLALPREIEHPLGRHVVPRRQIIRMSMDFVDQNGGGYVLVEQLATAAGVSQRTLRDAFHGYFGAAPVEYLKRRTLHLVRKALKSRNGNCHRDCYTIRCLGARPLRSGLPLPLR